MADAAEGKFDVVLVFHTSRFARNVVEARRYKQMLRETLGIRVISVTQPMGETHSDPSSFLAESIHEMFDEYYSVSLSFWVRSGLKEKARQGYLVGQLPWGYVRDPDSKLAVADPERAAFVQEIYERYATGQESDLTIAQWLNATGARTARNRPFSRDAVRTILCKRRLLRLRQRQSRTPAVRTGACTIRSSPRSCSSACRRCAAGAIACSRPVPRRRNTCCEAAALRPLWRAHARLSRRAQLHATLHVLGAHLRHPLRRAHRAGRALGVTARAVDPATSVPTRSSSS